MQERGILKKILAILYSIILVASLISLALVISIAQQEKEINNGLTKNLNNLQEQFTKLNDTQNNLIKYINDRNEPFMKEVVKYANETNLRIEKLESHK